MKILYGTCSDKGIRKENQDSMMCLLKEGVQAFAVADGVGGLNYGREAADIALNALRVELDECSCCSPEYLMGLISIKLRQINEHIYTISQKNNTSMATTVALVAIVQKSYVAANVGDTKIFQIRDNMIKTISAVHSLANVNYEGIQMHESNNSINSLRNVLTMAIGADNDLNPYISVGEVKDGDVYIICSDGVYNYVDEKYIKDLFSNNNIEKSEEMKKLCDMVINSAISGGADDNVTIIALKVNEEY